MAKWREASQIDEKYIKTYKTLDGLNKKIRESGLGEDRRVEVYTASGRVTAIFSMPQDSNPMRITSAGFMVFG